MIPDVKGKLYWVVGLARSGCAAAALLRRHGARVIGVDDAAEDAVRRRWDREGLTDLAPQAFDELALAGNWPSAAPSAVIISPGVPLEHERLQALPPEVPVLGEIELAGRFCRATVVGITGTNGKSTTTELVAHLARKAGHRAEALGNLGTPFAQVADTLPAQAVVSLELSSFQLETISSFAPRVGVVLNLAPDHLDRYADLAAYFAAKERLARCLPADGDFVTWTECPQARAWSVPAPVTLFGEENGGAMSYFRDDALFLGKGAEARRLVHRSELALQSPPNLLNALAGVAVGQVLGWEDDALAAGLRDFPGLAHRHQLVARRGGVKFVNDTKATNVHSVCAGLDGYPEPVVLIAGGSGKGEDYAPLAGVMDKVRQVVLIGQEGPAIGRALSGVVPTSSAGTMAEAVRLAADLAEPDAVVLLSPACASFDMFANYRVRGEAFAAAAKDCGAELI